MTEPSIWDELDGPVVNKGGVHRDGRDSPMVFREDHAGPYDYTKGKTVKGRSGYTRVTTWCDCLDDKSAIAVYNMRNVLRGLVKRPLLMADVREALFDDNPDDPATKAALNKIVAEAREAAYEDEKADRGTFVHGLCEQADLAIAAGMTRVEALDSLVDTTFIATDHRDDVADYLRKTRLFRPVLIEALTICDELKTAGTPDRLVEYIGPREYLKTPDGKWIEPGDIFVDDLKTGSVEYGVGKFAMQLAIYAHGVTYDQATNTRTPLPERLRTDWAIIVHLPAGSGEARLLWLDIDAGWKTAKGLVPKVKTWRNTSKKLAHEFPEPTLIERVASALTAAEARALWRDNRDDWTEEMTQLSKGLPA